MTKTMTKTKDNKMPDHNEQVTEERNFNILIGVTGSVATIKLIELLKSLDSKFPKTVANKTANKRACKVTKTIKIVATKNANHFIDKRELRKNSEKYDQLLNDVDEWNEWGKIGDPVLHIELRKWADILVIAPLDANTMAKMANGICDNLLTCTIRAWDVSKPLIYCPAMNVHMYEHPLTREHLTKLQSFGYLRVDSIEKKLACGDVGMGAMAPVDTIADKVIECLTRPIQVGGHRQIVGNCFQIKPPPLLNNQPTYPIIPLTATSLAQSSSKPMEQFRNTNGYPTNLSLIIKNKKHHQNNNGQSLLSSKKPIVQQKPIKRPSHPIIGSIENLKAIDSKRRDRLRMSILNHSREAAAAAAAAATITTDSTDGDAGDPLDADAEDTEDSDGFDPSRYLEQTLITEDSCGRFQVADCD